MKRLLKPWAYPAGYSRPANPSQTPKALRQKRKAQMPRLARVRTSASRPKTNRIPATLRGPKGTRRPDAVRWAVPLDPTSPTRGQVTMHSAQSSSRTSRTPSADTSTPPRAPLRGVQAPNCLISPLALHNKHARTFAHAAHARARSILGAPRAHDCNVHRTAPPRERSARYGRLHPMYGLIGAGASGQRRCWLRRASVGGTPVLFREWSQIRRLDLYADLNALVEEERPKP